ncbi:PG-binding-3 domain-containing protein [Acinetobacter baumannii]
MPPSGGFLLSKETEMNIEQYLDELIKREGGYVNNPADRGGATKFGITEAVARENGYKGNMKDLPLEFAKSIYKKQYWLEPRFDQVNALSPSVAEELLDTGVNCGPNFAKPLLQRALNLLNNQGRAGWPDLKVDGVYGSATLGALKTYLSKRGKDGEKVLVRVLNIMQGQRYIEICERNPKQEQFFYGWIANRIN